MFLGGCFFSKTPAVVLYCSNIIGYLSLSKDIFTIRSMGAKTRSKTKSA